MRRETRGYSAALGVAALVVACLLGCEEPATSTHALGARPPGTDAAQADGGVEAGHDASSSGDLATSDDLGSEGAPDLAGSPDAARQDLGTVDPIPWDEDADVQRKDVAAETQMVIVTTAELASAFVPLVERRWRQGLATRLLLMEEVASEPGRDRAERLRSRLQTLWSEGSLRYVLLGADTPAVPHREVAVEVDVAGVFYEASRFASDAYYAALEGDWDANGDGAFARPEDAPDLLPDVALARVPADTPDGVRVWMDKVLTYERGGAGDYLQRFLLLSEDTGYYGVDSAVALEEIATKIFPRRAELTRLYDDTSASELSRPATSAAMFDEFERGNNHVFHLGHGGTRNLYLLDAAQVRALGNRSRPSLYVTCACYGGAFQEEDAISETLLVGASGGALAYVGNADVGIGFPSGLAYLVAFYEAYFGADTSLRRFGDVVQEARVTFSTPEALGQALHPDRWTQLVLSILGDPATLLWREQPRPLALSYAAERVAGGVRVVAWALDEQVALPPAGVRITLSAPGAHLVTGLADDEGRVQFELLGVAPDEPLWLNAHGPRHTPAEVPVLIP